MKIFPVRFDIRTLIFFDGRKTKKPANVQAEVTLSHQRKTKQNKKHLAEASDGEIKKLVDNSATRNFILALDTSLLG